jgi:hypothetical protein
MGPAVSVAAASDAGPQLPLAASRRPPGAETAGDLLRAAVEAPPPFLRGFRPWCLRSGSALVTELWASPSADLRALDPVGRVVHIACGAALLRLRLAVAVAGREPVDRLLPCAGEPLLLATVRLAGPRLASRAERALYAAIGAPVADLLPGTAPVPAGVLGDLAQAAAIEGAVLDVVGPATALFRRPRPVPAATRPGSARLPGPAPLAGSRATAGLLAVISTRPGARAGWLRTGQALQRVLLLAATRGISATPFPPMLEAPDPRLAGALLALDIRQPQVMLQLATAAIPPVSAI